ncbi:MAG: hypothetical protein MRY64_05855 [Hyphomonadaceae bacterium]|nr:hypothetical protein [Hyphomonadaceae bacterium]
MQPALPVSPSRELFPKQGFLITPIGNSPEAAAYLSQFYERLIRPIEVKLEDDGYKLKIAALPSKDGNPKDIFQSIIQHICDDDIVIANLTGVDKQEHNPSVFLEVGLGIAFGRSPILFAHKEQMLASDLRMRMHCVYDDSHLDGTADSMQIGGPSHKAYEEILSILTSPDRQRERPYEGYRPPGPTVPLNRWNNIKFKELSIELLRAEKEVWLCGATLGDLIDPNKAWFFAPTDRDDPTKLVPQQHLSTLLLTCLVQGADVNVILMHPDNPFHVLRLEREKPEETASARFEDRTLARQKKAAVSLEQWRKLQASLAGELDQLERLGAGRTKPGFLRIFPVRTNPILHRITATEKVAFTTPYFYSYAKNSGPCIKAWPQELDEETAEDTNWFHSPYEELKYFKRLSLNGG